MPQSSNATNGINIITSNNSTSTNSANNASKSTTANSTNTGQTPTQPTAASTYDPNLIRTCTFVIQKYIEKPLLIGNRKFDIRIWVLVTQDMDVYIFKEGYIRTSSEEF